jgi:hypothetical protein
MEIFWEGFSSIKPMLTNPIVETDLEEATQFKRGGVIYG